MQNINKTVCLNHLYEELLKSAPILRDIEVKLNNHSLTLQERQAIAEDGKDEVRHIYYTFKKYIRYMDINSTPNTLTTIFVENVRVPYKYIKLMEDLQTKFIEVQEEKVLLSDKKVL